MVMSGGDADRLLPLIDDEVVHVPHLILEGLARLARDGERAG
jgi:pantothenate kinase type III